ncbi:glycosyltransferase family 2 protein [Lactobacillus xylocopicola]|uniref:Glycosyl transferase family 2 n=1 Tax=Lactobacillus xylocopicola TaxID=2976676 RepID=A0ABN6SLU0_9LACO|nr:glycosyltransferase family 2 protein [Lactobacillus xylocopicola]BDR59991.1 glycosyl transferase family 2 [Lactobacillus xylocopicola]
MYIFITITLIIGGIAFVFNLLWCLYLSFSKSVQQESYDYQQRSFETMLLFIPAMNEYKSLNKNMSKLLNLHEQCKHFIDLKFVFIDDASNDGTTELLNKFSHEENVIVIHRVKPNAQLGKGPALQNAADQIAQMNFSRDNTLIGVVDADARFDENYLCKVWHSFENSSYDLVQTRVNIYNTDNNLSTMQNFEFSIYNGLVQMARTNWGSSLASGNGQFVTLKMVEDVGWSSSLLEDCEFSLKGLLKGYYGTFLNTDSIGQEGVISLKKLIRQRIRWCQGGLQCLATYGSKIIKSSTISFAIKFYVLAFLLIPCFSVFLVPAAIFSLITLFYDAAFNFWLSIGAILVIVLIEYFSNSLMIVKQWRTTEQESKITFLKLLKVAFVIDLYRWVLAVVPYMAIARMLTGNNSWEKTSHS